MKKRILSVFLVVVMLFTMLPTFTISSFALTSGDFEYEILEDGTAEVVDYIGSSTELIIPSEIDGYTVTSIRFDALLSYYDRSSITNIMIPSSVTTIGDYSFAYCTSLVNLVIPSGVETIEFYAFFGCSSLENITISDSVKTIDLGAFGNCNSLTNIAVDENNKYYSSDEFGVLFDKDKYELVQYPIGNTRTSYIIPESVAIIGNSAFSSCQALSDIMLQNGVWRISCEAFKQCSSLENIVLPVSIGEIENSAFEGCTSLTSITIPDKVYEICEDAFYECNNLEDVYYSGSENEWNSIEILDGNDCLTNATIHFDYFENTFKYHVLNDGTIEITGYTGKIEGEVVLPETIDGYSVTSIGNYAFSYCTSLESVTIPASVTTIGDCAFYGCTSLHTVVLPDTEITIGQNAFWDTIYNDIRVSFDYIKLEDGTLRITICYAGSEVTELVFPSEINGYMVTEIGNGRAVMNARSALNVKKVVIPDSITAINDYAFEECDMLESITIGKGIKSIGMAAFYGCYSLEDLYYTGTATDWAKIEINSSGTSNPLWFARNEYFNGELVTDIIIEEGITEIRANTFAYCDSLRSIIIPNSVTSIGDYAFDGCQSLESVVLKEGINSIGEYAFYDCEALKSIIIPNSVSTIGEYAFAHCTSLESITIPNKAISIGSYAFYDTAYYNNEANWEDTGWDKMLYIGNHLIEARVLITLGPPHIDVEVGTKTVAGGAIVNAVTVTVPYGVELLGTNLFVIDYLESIELPSSLKTIKDDAFINCPNLTDIYYAGSKTQWDAIDKGNNAKYLQGVNIHYNYKGEYYKNGWIKENGKWAFFENDVKITNQWKKDSVGWCYLDSNGYMATNKWVKDSKGWCYVGANGYCVTNKWVKDSVGWCYLGADGRMVTNKWVKDSKGWCYVGADGYCVTDKWVADSKGWCYLGADGRMVTNKWVKDSKGWCYVGADGYCLTNKWVADRYGWCYLDSNGRMLYSSWVEYKGDIYYIDSNGYMVTGTQIINGTTYNFASNGALIV